MTVKVPRIAIAHDYLTQRGGAERVVLAMARTFPGAPIYTTLYRPEGTYPEFRDLDIRTSWLNRVPAFRRNHRFALPLLPLASSGFRIEADLVIASSSGWSHGFPTTGKKVVYCYTPARWLYQSDRYLGERGSAVTAAGLRVLAPMLRRWDRRAAASADSYLAISTVVRDRIQQVYGRPSRVVPAPFTLAEGVTATNGSVLGVGTRQSLPAAGYLLVVSRLLPYKNVDIVIEAFRSMPQHRLVVVGRGPEKSRLRAMASKNVAFLEDLTDAEMSLVYSRAAGLIAASHEDFGLTPLEAAARGKPSAVLRAGGFLDTMVDGETAVFFDQPQADHIERAVTQLLARGWQTDALRKRANCFNEAAFSETLRDEIERILSLSGSVGTNNETGGIDG